MYLHTASRRDTLTMTWSCESWAWRRWALVHRVIATVSQERHLTAGEEACGVLREGLGPGTLRGRRSPGNESGGGNQASGHSGNCIVEMSS